MEALEVSISGGNSFDIIDSLLRKNESAYLHLPIEYRNSVFRTIESLCVKKILNMNGKLDFRYGASAESSSNEWIFDKLANLVINLFKIQKEYITGDLIDKLIDSWPKIYSSQDH